MIIRILFLILLTIGVANSKSGDGGGSGGGGSSGGSSGGGSSGGGSSGGGDSSGSSSGGANDGKDNAEWQLYKAEINAIIFDITNLNHSIEAMISSLILGFYISFIAPFILCFVGLQKKI